MRNYLLHPKNYFSCHLYSLLKPFCGYFAHVKWSWFKNSGGNPQLPNPCGANNQSSPLVCLSYTWNCWCPGFLLQWTSSVGMLNSQILIPSFPGCLQWFANHTSGCSCFGIWSCRSDWNQGLGAASATVFVFSFSPLATRSKLWSYPGCVCRMWDGGGGGSPAVSAVLNKQAMQMWMEGKVGYCSTLSLCSGSWGNWEKKTELVWNCFKPADTQFPLPLLTLLPAKSFC